MTTVIFALDFSIISNSLIISKLASWMAVNSHLTFDFEFLSESTKQPKMIENSKRTFNNQLKDAAVYYGYKKTVSVDADYTTVQNSADYLVRLASSHPDKLIVYLTADSKVLLELSESRVKYALLNEGGEFGDTENSVCEAVATWLNLPLAYLNAFVGLFAQNSALRSDMPSSPTVSDPSPVLSVT